MIYPFLNLNSAAVEIWEWISNFILQFTLYWTCGYLSLPGFKLIDVSKMGI